MIKIINVLHKYKCTIFRLAVIQPRPHCSYNVIVYSLDFFIKERTLIPALLSNSSFVAFGVFCNVSCKLDQHNLRVQTNSKKCYVVLLVQILLQKSFFIQSPQGYQNDAKANKTICHASVLVWCMLDTESTFAKSCICF